MPKGVGLMLSRKQQWRKACGSTRHMTTHHAKRHADRAVETTPRAAVVGESCDSNTTPSSPFDKVGKLVAPAPYEAMEGGVQKAQRYYSSTDAALTAPLAGSAATGAIDPWGTEGGTGNNMNRRSVYFDTKIRVILVPTRHELKEQGAEDQSKDSDAGDDQGIWWSLQECFEFRRAYRRQILKLGLTQCKTLLCPATVVFLCDEPEEEEEADKEGEVNSNSGQMMHEAIAAAAAASTTAVVAAAHVGCPVVEEVMG